jgi:hypothetical protein
VQPLWKKIWRLPKNLNIDLPYDPAIPLLGIYPKECSSGFSRGTCTPMFIAALFTVYHLLWCMITRAQKAAVFEEMTTAVFSKLFKRSNH